MGEAKRRGTFEQRRAQAMNNNRIPMRAPGVGGVPGQIQIDANDTIEKHCEACDGQLFDLAYRYRILPSVSVKNPTGKDMPIKFETYMCRTCGHELGKAVKTDSYNPTCKKCKAFPCTCGERDY